MSETRNDTNVPFGDGLITCQTCGLRAHFMEFDEEEQVELYQCKNGHFTEVPEQK